VQSVAFAQNDVTVALTAQRVMTVQGKEAFAPADQARPGEVIEYRATYTNTSNSPVRELLATLPVPAGLEYLPQTAQPTRLTASVDGRSFEPVPLKRKVRLADGRVETRLVPAAEYRYLRWSIGSLAAMSSRAVSARMRVAPLESVAAVPTR
jgi:uncharacterized repeat protein (TIGR01451 family)